MKIGGIIIAMIWLCPAMSQDTVDRSSKAKLKISGYADLYYQYDFNVPAAKLRPPFLYNFKKHDQLNVNLALLKGSFEGKKLRANLGLMAGNYATYNLAPEPEFWQYIYEASIGYRFSDKFSINAGIFPSHIGNESAIAKDNYTLSRSLIAENSPYYATGIKLNYIPSDKWSISLFGLNGWQHIKDNNSSKAIGTQVQFMPNERMLFNSSTFLGNEKPDSAKQGRFFHNFFITYQITSKLNLGFAFDIGLEKKADKSGYNSWTGSSLLVQYIVSKKISLSGRAEFYKDKKGVIVPNYLPTEFITSGCSFNIDYRPFRYMVVRSEIRSLNSPNDIYIRNNNSVNSNFSWLTSLAFYF